MKRETEEWAAMKKRLKAQGLGRASDVRDPNHEWFMPLDGGPRARAWRKWADAIGCRYDDSVGREGVAWDFPVTPRMNVALKLAEEFLADKPKGSGLKLVIEDLRSYRDTGYSSRSPEKPKG